MSDVAVAPILDLEVIHYTQVKFRRHPHAIWLVNQVLNGEFSYSGRAPLPETNEVIYLERISVALVFARLLLPSTKTRFAEQWALSISIVPSQHWRTLCESGIEHAIRVGHHQIWVRLVQNVYLAIEDDKMPNAAPIASTIFEQAKRGQNLAIEFGEDALITSRIYYAAMSCNALYIYVWSQSEQCISCPLSTSSWPSRYSESLLIVRMGSDSAPLVSVHSAPCFSDQSSLQYSASARMSW